MTQAFLVCSTSPFGSDCGPGSFCKRPVSRTCIAQTSRIHHFPLKNVPSTCANITASIATAYCSFHSLSTPNSRPQTFDFTTLALTLSDLRQILPLRVQSVHQPDASTLTFHLLSLDGPRVLTINYAANTGARLTVTRPNIISAGPQYYGTKLQEKRSRKAKKIRSFSLGEIVFSLVAGLVLVEARLERKYERIGCLEFAEEVDGQIKFRVFVELLGGGRNNVVIVDHHGIVKAAGRQVSDKAAKRALQTGRSYESPPSPPGLFVEECQLERAVTDMAGKIRGRLNSGSDGELPRRDRKVSAALVRLFAGLSPLMAEELTRCASITSDVHIGELSLEEKALLSKQVRRWYDALQGKEDISPGLIDRGGYSALGWSAPSGTSFVQPPASWNMSELVESYYSEWHSRSSFLQMRGQLEKIATAQVKQWYSREEGFLSKIKRADEAADLHHQGDLLFAYAHTWSSDSDEVICQDLDGRNMRIKLPPGKTPTEYASAMHKKAQKLRRSRELVTSLRAHAKIQKDYWQSVLMTIKLARDLGDLMEISEEVSQAKNAEVQMDPTQSLEPLPNKKEHSKRELQSNKAVGNSQKETRRRKMMRRNQEQVCSDFIRIQHEPTGYEIIIGRNNRQNELLSFTEARKSDLWLHVADKPGAHVLCRNPDGGLVEQDHEALKFAADLAAWFSSARGTKRVDVNVVRAKELRRIGGSPRRLGLVGFTERTVIEGLPDRVKNIASPLVEA